MQPNDRHPSLNESNEPNTPPFRYRPLLIVLFALLLLCVASTVKAQAIYGPAGSIDFDQRPYQFPEIDRSANSSSQMTSVSPAYAEVTAELANFDSDANPDGWRAIVVLRDKDDQVVQPNGRVEFELKPRFPNSDFQGFKNAQRTPMKWSPKLTYNSNGTASFKLPLRKELRPLWGWSSAVVQQTGSRSTIVNDRATYLPRHNGRSDASRLGSGLPTRPGSTLPSDWRTNVTFPELGRLQVKVFVPSQGVFQAVTIVRVRSSKEFQ